MKNQKMYEADDKMISLIRDNYDLLQMLGSFGISLGFGDKTVMETCEDNGVDTYTFLAVVNYNINGYGEFGADEMLSVPAIRHLEQQTKQMGVTRNITDMVFKASTGQNPDALSDREKDVIISLVQGMANKEIADHLCISVNTVITHRRNIARKLQIHSPAGLTIYAIVNGLVDISSVKI